MRYLYERMHWLVLAFATVALILIAAFGFRATASFAESAKWVAHTHQVETMFARIRSNLFASQDALVAESVTSDPSFHTLYTQSESALAADVAQVRELTADNPAQQSRLDNLEGLIKSRDAALTNLVSSTPASPTPPQPQTQQDAKRDRFMAGQAPTIQALAVLDEMLADEERLLAQRNEESALTYMRARIALAAVYAIVVIVLFVYLRGLVTELRNRERAEEAVQRLSGRLLQLQDAERRKIARELHDSFGQTFAALKLNLDQVAMDEHPDSARSRSPVAEASQLLERCMIEARTLSHLLHPPLLDELGFVSAARAYIEGYSARCHVQVNLDLPNDLERLPEEIELTLFRALQESLTNIHRHSGSETVDIRLTRTANAVNLTVRDYGKGIPPDVAKSFANRTGAVGIGLAGMRERVRQLKGQLNIRPARPGTLLAVSLPLPANRVTQTPAERNRSSNLGPEQIPA